MNGEFGNNDQADAPKIPSSRRSFLTRAAGVSALAVPTLTLVTSRKAHASGAKKLTGLNAELINEIQSDEDQHVPIIQNLLDDPDNSLLGQALVEDFAPVEAPISQSVVLARVAEFVTDHRSTFPSFDTTVATDANGFFVLDFVLFLEYIESAFYDLNVPMFT